MISAQAGAALACYAAATARTAPSLAVAVGVLHCALALVARLGGADAVATNEMIHCRQGGCTPLT